MGKGTYLDAVLDSNMMPLFNGIPEKVVEWLIATADDWKMQQNARVCIGRTLETVSIDDYLRSHNK